ncbi:MAG: rRNA (uridine2552-2-O)-methyltransferase [Pseudomonadota bacterium]|nr:rRNA (uridine2552-2-O)-methyltransferase [Pseudomonadota bacterium]
MLYGTGFELFAEFCKIGFTDLAVVAVDADLDQFVAFQRGVDFLQHGFGETVLADRNDGIEAMGAGAERAALVGSQLQHRNTFIKTRILSFSASSVIAMARTKTSKAWLQEHVNDPYVQKAKAEGWRSRAAFKLMEIDDRDKLIRPGEVVVDLGAAPGGWSQVAANRLKGRGRVIALDLLEMPGIPGVDFFQGDFRDDTILALLEEKLAGDRVGLVLSDMAPNISGISVSDQARMMHLAELGLEFSRNWLKPEGAFLVKVFQGYGYDEFFGEMKNVFKTVSTRKPDASRDRSAELYLLGKGLR